jgi:predicted RNA-binding Zn ribbon-like protein
VKTGQWFESAEGTRWFYDSGALCLDFVYTADLGTDAQASGDLIRTPYALGDWLRERFERVDTAAGDRELADAHGLRDAILRVAVATALDRKPQADAVDTINLFAAIPDVPPTLAGGARQAGAGSVRTGQALSSIARDAVRLFADHSGDGRIRPCSAEDCELIFYDESRTANRRWCSMQRCGNRAKVRAHRARTGPATP